jgi:hypothetical protein
MTLAKRMNNKGDNMSNGSLRQGDIYLVPVKEVPEGLTEVPRENGRIVLAEGEATGHLHAIDSPEALFLAEDIDAIEGRFLKVEAEVALEHPEHGTITVAPGNYEVRRQVEYSEAGGISIVAD